MVKVNFKRSFFKTTTREKFLLILVVGGGAVYWLSDAIGRYSAIDHQTSVLTLKIEDAENYLGQADSIERELQERTESLDSSRTLSSIELVGRVSELIRPLEIKYSINSPQSEEQGLFTFHSIRLTVQKGDMLSILKFSEKLKELAPYVTLDKLTITAGRVNKTELDAQFYISSIELNTP